MAKRLSPEERQRRADEKARKKREREAARAAKQKAKAEEKARKQREKEERRRQKEIERGRAMKRKPRWLYWLAREQEAKKREHEQYMNAGRVALALGRAIRKIQQKIMAFMAPLLNYVAGMKTPEARLVWKQEPWTPQDRTRYNWGKKQELAELWQQFPNGVAEQDPEEAAADAKRKTRARRIDRAKVIDRVLDKLTQELAEDEQNAVRSSLERSYKQVYADIYKELQDGRRAIDADKADETRIADARDYTRGGNPRRTAPETKIPQNMPRLGNYGESVVFGAPSPDQIKAVLNAQFEGKDYSARIWKDRDKLAAELKDMMQAAIINGENSRIVAQKLAQKMGVEFSHAQRLIRTEMNRILNQSILDQAKASGAEEYQFVAIEDSRTCARCLKKNGKVYKISEKKVGLNCPPLHPHCRCTIIARYAWENNDETPNTPTPSPDDRGTQKTIESWLKEVDAIEKSKANAVRNNPTKANAQAAAEAQDAAMKAEEQRQQTALGMQRKAFAVTGKTAGERQRQIREIANQKKELKDKAAEYRRQEAEERKRLEQRLEEARKANLENEKAAWNEILEEEEALKSQIEEEREVLRAQYEEKLAQLRPQWEQEQRKFDGKTQHAEALIETHPWKGNILPELDAEQNRLKNAWRQENAERERMRQEAARAKADETASQEAEEREAWENSEWRAKERFEKQEEEIEAKRQEERSKREKAERKAAERKPRKADRLQRIQDNTKEANERLEAEHKRNMATMNEDTQAEIEKDARKSKERIRKMKAEAERERREARRNAEAEKADMEAEVNNEIEMANRKVDLAREIWASSKTAIADSAKRQAVAWARTFRARRDLNLTEREYERQAEAYKQMLTIVLEGDEEPTKQALREYAQAVGLESREEALLSVLNPKILSRTIPPAYFADMHAGRNYVAFRWEGAIRMCKEAEDWNGDETTLTHETGHYLDQTILRRTYDRTNPTRTRVKDDPLGIQAAFEEDKRRLNQRRNPVNFRIGNETFTKEEFRRGNLWELDQKLRRVVAEALNPESSARTVSEYCGIIMDAFQSVMGPNYGTGHNEDYARIRLNTNIEAIAEITSTIFGNDFLSDVFPNAFNRIKAIYEGEE